MAPGLHWRSANLLRTASMDALEADASDLGVSARVCDRQATVSITVTLDLKKNPN